MSSPPICIVGAGPAGLMAALAAARRGAAVVLFEQLARPGAKLLASGGGRCNLTNTLAPTPFMEAFGRHGRFMAPALAVMGAPPLRALLAELGVPTKAPDGRHVYPVSESAVTVHQALLRACAQAGVTLRCQTPITALWAEASRLRGLLVDGQPLPARAVVLATGGRGYPALGGGELGYRLARQAGHSLSDPVPALAPLLTREAWPKRLAGLSLPTVRLTVEAGPARHRPVFSGALLFTHTGISGPVALDASGAVAQALRQVAPVPIRLNLLPDAERGEWLAQINQWAVAQGRKQVVTLLAERVPAALAAQLATLAQLPEALPAARLSRPQREALADLFTALPLSVTATGGFEHAMVTRGGVKLGEVDPQTLASRRLPGLYLAGEVLDLDGPCGGFNLQWAFASGWLAGAAAAAGD